jgi:hypothetical protein
MASGRRSARAGGPPPEPRGVLFRHPPRALRGARAWQIGARTVHIAAMALVLGGVAWRAPARDLVAPMAITALSGVVLLGIDLGKSFAILYQGSGVAALLKLVLLGAGSLLPSARLEWYLAATVVASIGSHMPGAWRHYSFLHRRVLDAFDEG